MTEHDVETCEDDHTPTLSVRDRIRRTRTSLDHRWASTKTSWAPSVRVAASVRANKGMLADEPRLRATIDGELARQVAECYPARWRYDDAVHHGANAVRAALGRPVLPVLWRDEVTVTMRTDDADMFVRNEVLILAEVRRVPVHP